MLESTNQIQVKSLWKKTLVGLFYIGCTVILFFPERMVNSPKCNAYWLLLFSAVTIYILEWSPNWQKWNVYCTRKDYVLVFAVSAYASFASFGQRFFLNGNTRMHFSLRGVACWLQGALWFIPVVCVLLIILEGFSAKICKRTRKHTRKFAFWVLLLSLGLCQGGIVWILWPGGYPHDAFVQLGQALGIYQLTDWHPIIHTLAERAILQVVPSSGVIVATQMLLFSWLLTETLMLGYDRGVSLPVLVAIGIIVEILPNQALTGCNLLKDYPFTLALIWGSYLLFHLLTGTKWSDSGAFYICLSVDIFLMFTLRHNGIIPATFTIMACILLTVRYFKRIRYHALTAIVSALALLILYKGPVMKLLNVVPNEVSPYTTMLCAVGSCINKGLPLSDEATAIMEEVMSKEDWANYYARYLGHDVYAWGRPEGHAPYDTSSINTRKAFRVYLEALYKYPDVVVKDRLDGMDIMWDIVQPEDSFNSKSFFFIEPFNESEFPIDTTKWTQIDDGRYFKYTPLAKMYLSTTEWKRDSIQDMLIWRAGAYLIAFFALLLFWIKHNMMEYLLVASPLVGNVLISMLLVYHQSFRYVWFVQILVMMLVFLTIIQAKEQEKRDT